MTQKERVNTVPKGMPYFKEHGCMRTMAAAFRKTFSTTDLTRSHHCNLFVGHFNTETLKFVRPKIAYPHSSNTTKQAQTHLTARACGRTSLIAAQRRWKRIWSMRVADAPSCLRAVLCTLQHIPCRCDGGRYVVAVAQLCAKSQLCPIR